jgi:hypothetical protein
LGHRINAEGIKVAREKLVQMGEWKIPTSGEMIMKQTGFLNYFRDFIPGYAKLMAPIEKLRFADNIEWSDEHQAINRKIRSILESDLIISHPNYAEPFLVATDASKLGIGAALFQEIEGQKSYIRFSSRSLSSSEQNYGATKRELLAIVFALKAFRAYIWGSRFKVLTDHKALTFMFSQKKTNELIDRWFETLLDFDFEIIVLEYLTCFLMRCPVSMMRLRHHLEILVVSRM